ncbi:MAG: phosphoribosylanthranilate isomerase, partial [Saprospiraceae bacterium]|nr:phosphoribosylanthranilate isomerase [Saprospiraceae bacterium]
FLFDTKGLYRGGNGELFDWTLLKKYEGKTPFLLSGGIRPTSVDDIHAFQHPAWAGIDINSRFEIRPGMKNIATIKKFKHDIYS